MLVTEVCCREKRRWWGVRGHRRHKQREQSEQSKTENMIRRQWRVGGKWDGRDKSRRAAIADTWLIEWRFVARGHTYVNCSFVVHCLPELVHCAAGTHRTIRLNGPKVTCSRHYVRQHCWVTVSVFHPCCHNRTVCKRSGSEELPWLSGVCAVQIFDIMLSLGLLFCFF